MKRFLAVYTLFALGIAAYTWQTTPKNLSSSSTGFTPAPTFDDYAWMASLTVIKGLPVILVVLLCTWVAAAIWARVRYAAPDSAGRLPIPRQHLADVATEALAAYHTVELERARNQVPERFTYAPHLRFASTAAAPAMLEAEHTPAAAPTFAQLLASGQIGKDAPLILGYTDDGPLQGTRQEITALAIGGKSQTGKSTTTRYIAANLALQGCKFIVCDPHGKAQGDARDKNLASTLMPLRSAFLCDVAIDESEILSAVALAHRIFEQRKQGMPADYPLLLIIDEFSAVMRNAELAKLLLPLLEAFPTEAPKFDVSGLFLGQQWEPSRCGGKVFQRALGGAYLHRMHPDSARMLCGVRDPLLSTVATLPAGQALLYRTTGSFERVRVPNTTATDLEHIGYQLATPAATALPPTPAPIKPVCSQSVASVSPEARHAAELFLAGQSPAEIVLQLRGIKSSEGGRYQTALGEVLELVRIGVKAERV